MSNGSYKSSTSSKRLSNELSSKSNLGITSTGFGWLMIGLRGTVDWIKLCQLDIALLLVLTDACTGFETGGLDTSGGSLSSSSDFGSSQFDQEITFDGRTGEVGLGMTVGGRGGGGGLVPINRWIRLSLSNPGCSAELWKEGFGNSTGRGDGGSGGLNAGGTKWEVLVTLAGCSYCWLLIFSSSESS